MCKHQNVERGPEKCYEGHFDVARAAQGGIEWKETCVDCGATRWVALNGRHRDASGWTIPATQNFLTKKR